MDFDEFNAGRERIRREFIRRLQKCGILLSGEIKKVISVPAPRRRYQSGSRSITVFNKATKQWQRQQLPIYRYVATESNRATFQRLGLPTRNTPPRKLSGRLRASITWQVLDDKTVRVGTNVEYAGYLEEGRWVGRGTKRARFIRHPFMISTFKANESQLRSILTG